MFTAQIFKSFQFSFLSQLNRFCLINIFSHISNLIISFLIQLFFGTQQCYIMLYFLSVIELSAKIPREKHLQNHSCVLIDYKQIIGHSVATSKPNKLFRMKMCSFRNTATIKYHPFILILESATIRFFQWDLGR